MGYSKAFQERPDLTLQKYLQKQFIEPLGIQLPTPTEREEIEGVTVLNFGTLEAAKKFANGFRSRYGVHEEDERVSQDKLYIEIQGYDEITMNGVQFEKELAAAKLVQAMVPFLTNVDIAEQINLKVFDKIASQHHDGYVEFLKHNMKANKALMMYLYDGCIVGLNSNSFAQRLKDAKSVLTGVSNTLRVYSERIIHQQTGEKIKLGVEAWREFLDVQVEGELEALIHLHQRLESDLSIDTFVIMPSTIEQDFNEGTDFLACIKRTDGIIQQIRYQAKRHDFSDRGYGKSADEQYRGNRDIVFDPVDHRNFQLVDSGTGDPISSNYDQFLSGYVNALPENQSLRKMTQAVQQDRAKGYIALPESKRPAGWDRVDEYLCGWLIVAK